MPLMDMDKLEEYDVSFNVFERVSPITPNSELKKEVEDENLLKTEFLRVNTVGALINRYVPTSDEINSKEELYQHLEQTGQISDQGFVDSLSGNNRTVTSISDLDDAYKEYNKNVYLFRAWEF